MRSPAQLQTPAPGLEEHDARSKSGSSSSVGTVMKAAGALAAASSLGNSVLARAVLTGAYEAVKALSDEQRSFLNRLSHKKEIERHSFTSYSDIISQTPLSDFPFRFDTPAVQALGEDARRKVGVIS